MSFNCQSDGYVQWFHKELKSYPISTSFKIITENVTFTNGGIYYCHGSTFGRKHKPNYFISSAEVLVYGNFANFFTLVVVDSVDTNIQIQIMPECYPRS